MNLLKRLKARKVISRRRKNWTVCRNLNGKVFFIHNIDDDTGAVMWSPLAGRAVRFRTERGCKLFINKTINKRKDVYVGSLGKV